MQIAAKEALIGDARLRASLTGEIAGKLMYVPLKQTLKHFNADLVFEQVTSYVRQRIGISRAKLGRIDNHISTNYLRQHRTRKLHIGCGGHLLKDGWLNADYYPVSPKVLHLDATRRFPCRNEEFDFIFSEHMIEHVPYSKGLLMLSECFRTLKRNGTLRLSTPDLLFLIQLYDPRRSKAEDSYIQWATKAWMRDAPYPDAVFVINNFMRNWGHTFIYDERTLREALQKAGFAKITRCQLHESEHDALRGLENIERLPEGLLKLETVTLEAAKVI